MRRLIALPSVIILALALTSVTWAGPATALAAQNEWAPCPSSEPGPPYAVIVKGVYGTCVHYQGQVYQFDTNTGKKNLLVDITNAGFGVWENEVWLTLASASLGSSIYENNIVYFVGRLDGTYSFTNTLGGSTTVPAIDVTQIGLASTKPKTTTTTTKTSPATTTTSSHTPGATGAPRIVSAVPTANSGNSNGGYVLYSNGKLVAVGGAPFYGDARASRLDDFVALAQDGSNNGYWLVTATGKVYTYGSVCQGDTIKEPQIVAPIVGTMFLTAAQQDNDNIDTGFEMVNAQGTIYSYLCVASF